MIRTITGSSVASVLLRISRNSAQLAQEVLALPAAAGCFPRGVVGLCSS